MDMLSSESSYRKPPVMLSMTSSDWEQLAVAYAPANSSASSRVGVLAGPREWTKKELHG